MFSEEGQLQWAAEYRTWGMVRRLWRAEPDNDNTPVGVPGPGGIGSYTGGSGPRTTGITYGNLALKDDAVWQEATQLCPIRFQGQWEDAETGLYYRFRHYDPFAGQYVSPDPIGIIAGVRRHSYVAVPTTLVDSFGLAAWTPMGSGICIVQKFSAGSQEAAELEKFVGAWNEEIIGRGGRMTAGPLTDLQKTVQDGWRRRFRDIKCCGPGQVAGHVPDAAAGGLPNPAIERGLVQMKETNSYLGGISGDLARKQQSYTWVYLRNNCD